MYVRCEVKDCVIVRCVCMFAIRLPMNILFLTSVPFRDLDLAYHGVNLLAIMYVMQLGPTLIL